jgi:hypothetical protein
MYYIKKKYEPWGANAPPLKYALGRCTPAQRLSVSSQIQKFAELNKFVKNVSIK